MTDHEIREAISTITTMNGAIEKESEGLSYNEMMQNAKIVKMMQERDALHDKVTAAKEAQYKELKKDPFWGELME